MPTRTLSLAKETLTALDPAELAAVAAATGGTVTFEHLACHPTLRLRCPSVLDCPATG